MKDQDAMKKDLISRGQRYHKIICDEQSRMRYKGLVIAENHIM